MNLDTLFAAIFGIYFATTVATSSKFHPFDSTAAVACDRRALARLCVSFLFLNAFPFAYFLWVLALLGRSPRAVADDWYGAFGVLFASLAGFGFYRLFGAVMTIKRCGDKTKFCFYSDGGDHLSHRLKQHVQHREPPLDATSLGFLPGVAGAILWLVVCFGAFWLLTL